MNSYNSETYNGGKALTALIQDGIVINGFSLQNDYICTQLIEEGNNIDFTNFDYPKNNGRGFLGYFNRGKQIKLNITVKGNSISDFQKRLDELRKNIFKSEVNLDIKVDGVVRRIKVNCLSAPRVLNHYNITFLKVEISFETLEPFFYELSNQTNSFLNKTSSFDEYITNKGGAVADLRNLLVFKTGLSGVTQVIFTVGDKTITINENISDNDVLLINGETKEVLLNNVVVDYDGVFPLLETDGNAINFTINGIFDVDITILNKKNYV